MLPTGLVLLLVAVVAEDIAVKIIVGALGALLFAYAVWPRLVLTDSEVVVRNLRTHHFERWAVRGFSVGNQTPYMGLFWRIVDSLGGRAPFGSDGWLGILVETGERPIAVCALQGTSPFFNIRKSPPSWVVGLQLRLDAELQVQQPQGPAKPT